jgi:transcriptional regulator with XRE-family HTH domain
MNLRDWRKSKGWDQAELAEKIGSNQKTYSAYETARLKDIPPEIQAKIRKLGYTGPWPRQESAAAPSIGYATIEEVAELRGALKAHVEYWREGEGKVLLRLEELARRIEAIERRGSQ